MSLDKFVMRGYTSSLGQSSGQWVAKSSDSQQGQTFQPNNDGGTSFVLGGGLSQPQRRAKNNGSGYSDPDYEHNPREIMTGGSQHRRDAPSGCFGSKGGSNGTGSGGMDGQKAIMFIFIIVMAIFLAVVALSGAGKSDANNNTWKKRPIKKGQQEAPINRGQPVWY